LQEVTLVERIGPEAVALLIDPSPDELLASGDSGEAERWFRKEAERYFGMIPNTIGA
jgi:hypothetical protein